MNRRDFLKFIPVAAAGPSVIDASGSAVEQIGVTRFLPDGTTQTSTIVMRVDGRQLARAVVRAIPEELRRR